MDVDSRGKPFANAVVARTPDYFRATFHILERQRRSRWVSRTMAALCVAGGLFFLLVARPAFYGWLLIGYALFIEAWFWFRKEKWIRDRVADVPSNDTEMNVDFFEDTLVVSTAVSASEIEWNSMYKAVHVEEGLLIYPQRGAAFYVPNDSVQPLSAIATVLQKVKKRTGA